jgi:phosphoribosylanthranilate isomerase
VDELTEGTHHQLKKALPNVKIVQVLHVINEKSVVEAVKIAPNVDAILLDSGNPNLIVKELGGTGRVHNWELSKQIVKKVKIPVFLAGGISKNNVLKAIEVVNPYGLDLCSSVRTNGMLDKEKLIEFFQVIKNK